MFSLLFAATVGYCAEIIRPLEIVIAFSKNAMILHSCPSKHLKTTDCAAKGSLREVRSNCNGKNSCTVKASNSVFGDPCFGTFKYVEMVYICRSSRWQTVTVCEGKSKTLTCGANQAIAVRSGYYGRSDAST